MRHSKIVGVTGEEIKINVLLHLGEVLAGELEARGEVKSAFAIRIGMYPSHFSDLLKGKRDVSAGIAIKLEDELKIPAEFWLGLQMDYDLQHERQRIKG
jgi:HTH-type transcriptional regulator/antitoxin HigA